MRSSSRCESGRLFVQTWPLLTVNRNYDGEQRCRLSQGLRRVQYEHQPYRGPQRHRRVLHIGHADLCKSVHSLVARPRDPVHSNLIYTADRCILHNPNAT
ncbi:hypothetical protein L596_007727 [Steinernema carpocapsae]|uniref:Uncharacterized protein n=1 Tax=Steinernema carpocapsae TaxID=34508 RepID=A0A4U5PAT3_STECR|nr:hypothetical protein L596_007727 [Steinernema carpocapsae]